MTSRRSTLACCACAGGAAQARPTRQAAKGLHQINRLKMEVRMPRLQTTLRLVSHFKPLEPIQEVRIHEQRDGLVKRRSMSRIMASRMKAATVRAERSKARARRRLRLIQ